MTRVRNGLTKRELDVISGWWHEGTVKGAAELLNLSEQTAKNELRTARLRTGATTTLALARMYAGQLHSVAVLRRHARRAA
ncbi:MAG: hypothetical protein M3N43_14780 [Actinomycetota bacterium]|nr:hypothetical protein [Actinomycetota bacterium]